MNPQPKTTTSVTPMELRIADSLYELLLNFIPLMNAYVNALHARGSSYELAIFVDHWSEASVRWRKTLALGPDLDQMHALAHEMMDLQSQILGAIALQAEAPRPE